MEGEPGVQYQQACVAEDILSTTIYTQGVSRALASNTYQGTAVKSVRAQQFIKIVLTPGEPLC